VVYMTNMPSAVVKIQTVNTLTCRNFVCKFISAPFAILNTANSMVIAVYETAELKVLILLQFLCRHRHIYFNVSAD